MKKINKDEQYDVAIEVVEAFMITTVKDKKKIELKRVAHEEKVIKLKSTNDKSLREIKKSKKKIRH